MLLIFGFFILSVSPLFILANQFGVFPMEPFAGLVVIAIGGLFIGSRIGTRSDPASQLAATSSA